MAVGFDSNACNAYIFPMSTTLTIRKLDESVKQRLRLRAAMHERSMESEARDILTRSVTEDGSGTGEASLSPQERMRKAIESFTGIWAGRGTTDELMRMTRGED